MLESEIIKQLKTLKAITPNEEYSKLSKFIVLYSKNGAFEMIPDKSTVKKVSALKNIFPSNEFAGVTRKALLAHPKTFAEKLGRIFSPAYFADQGIKYAFSAAMAALILVVSIGGFSVLRVAPGVDNRNLTAEAETMIKDININLEGADYFATTANKTRVALNDAKGNGATDHSNQEIIKNEIRSFDFENPADIDINKLLNEATI